jgi:hypothetical protein
LHSIENIAEMMSSLRQDFCHPFSSWNFRAGASRKTKDKA